MFNITLNQSGLTYELAEKHDNPNWVKVLRILKMDKTYQSAEKSWYTDNDGVKYLDFHTGEGVVSLGHNHPVVKKTISDVLENNLPGGIQIQYNSLSGALAKALTDLLPTKLNKVFFTNSGAEAVETALKFARYHSEKSRFISCVNAFHGLSFGALSIIGEDYFKEGVGPLLPGCQTVEFGNLQQLEDEFKKNDVAAFISEAIQGREVTTPDQKYFAGVQRLCKKYNVLFIMDEIQTGLGRTGRMFALEHWHVEPDIVLIAKALSGGIVPVGAVIYTNEIYNKVFNTLRRSYVHHSTFGRNSLAMAAGLATLSVIEDENLLGHVSQMSQKIQDELLFLQDKYELIKEIRVKGLMIGLELGAPRSIKMRVNWEIIQAASPGLFAQLIVLPLMEEHHIIAMVSGENDVIKLLPPLNITSDEIDYFINALDQVLNEVHSSKSKNWVRLLDIVKSTSHSTIRSYVKSAQTLLLD